MRDLTINDIVIIQQRMSELQKEHPKAKIIYAVERGDIIITYPLPVDFCRPTYRTKEENF